MLIHSGQSCKWRTGFCKKMALGLQEELKGRWIEAAVKAELLELGGGSEIAIQRAYEILQLPSRAYPDLHHRKLVAQL